MRTIILLLTLLSLGLYSFGQQDARARAILNDVSAKSKIFKAVQSDFSLVITDTRDQSNTMQSGKIWSKGNIYKIEMDEVDVYFDGKDMYTHLKEENEVNITVPDPGQDDFFFTNPSQLFTLHEKGFKHKLIGEVSRNGVSMYDVDLYPIDLKKDFSRIKLYIEKSTLMLNGIKIFGKDGTQISITFSNMVTDKDISEFQLKFDPSRHKGILVNDMR
jgi:outer membrane lipoprotein-sorting protein